ncbi:hypothetical protein FGIG_02402 [Fasciola gigantica]|uniref:Uncharacterized protein n=1 Tax=Fasciola gigantica TaxID=46835 RepID=A0A504YNK5_FASGI|nr:hypothetical protein FGIG_02402 [Fasciola gigantica]
MDVILCRGNGQLQSCVLSADTSRLVKLLKRNFNVNTVNQYRESALYVAAYFSEQEMVEILLKNGADVNCNTIEGNTPLHAAAYSGNVDLMKILINFGANPLMRNNKGLTADDIFKGFMRTKMEGHQDNTEALEKSMADVAPSSEISPGTHRKMASILERFRCRNDRKETFKRIRHAKPLRTKIGMVLSDLSKVTSYCTAIPIAEYDELKGEVESEKSHEDQLTYSPHQ